MAWVSPKVYAILSKSEEGKDILEGIADKDQAEVDKEVDAFFGKGGKGYKSNAEYSQAKMDDEAEENAYKSMGDEEVAEHEDADKEEWKTTKMASGTIHELGDKGIIEEENEKGDTQYRIGGTNGQVFSSLEEAKKAVDKEKYQSILKKAFNALDKQDAMDIIFSNTEVHKAFQKVQRENPNDSFWYQLSLLPDKLYGDK